GGGAGGDARVVARVGRGARGGGRASGLPAVERGDQRGGGHRGDRLRAGRAEPWDDAGAGDASLYGARAVGGGFAGGGDRHVCGRGGVLRVSDGAGSLLGGFGVRVADHAPGGADTRERGARGCGASGGAGIGEGRGGAAGGCRGVLGGAG